MKGSGGGAALGFLGYCPQENVLWPNLTVKEHLELYAAVKGLKKKDAVVTITRDVEKPHLIPAQDSGILLMCSHRIKEESF